MWLFHLLDEQLAFDSAKTSSDTCEFVTLLFRVHVLVGWVPLDIFSGINTHVFLELLLVGFESRSGSIIFGEEKLEMKRTNEASSQMNENGSFYDMHE